MSDECKTKFRIDVEFNFSFKDLKEKSKKLLTKITETNIIINGLAFKKAIRRNTQEAEGAPLERE